MTHQPEQRLMAYPTSGLWKWAFKAPLVLWRMGFGPLLGRMFIVFTTTGRKSGLPRSTMTEYARVGGKVVVASGWGAKAQWVKNIQADPVITIQTSHETQACRAARITDCDMLSEVFQAMQHSPAFYPTLATWGIEPPTPENLLANPDKAYFYVLEPTDEPAPPPMVEDLRWVTWLTGAILLIGLVRALLR